MHRSILYKAYQYANSQDIQTTAEGKSTLRYAYQHYLKKGVCTIMAIYFLWAGVTVFVALAPIAVGPISLAGWLCLVGLILLILGK